MHATPFTANLWLGPAQSGGGDPTFSFIILALLFAGMWFLLIAPQRKRQKQHDAMIQSLRKGDHIITSGGLFGVIDHVKEKSLKLKVAEGVVVEVAKNFVSSKQEKEDDPNA